MDKEKARKAMDEIMTLYKSNKLDEITKIRDDKQIIIGSLKTQFGRDYFTKILTNGYKQDYLVKNLVNESYYFFYDVIFNTLLDILKLEENDENINDLDREIDSQEDYILINFKATQYKGS